ncbi:MAG: HAD hydrolase-like protein [Candidatus Micrarchaeia archaeon]
MAGTITVKAANKTDFRPVMRRMDWHLKNGGKAFFLDADRVLFDSDSANATSMLMLMGEYGIRLPNMTLKKFLDACSGLSAREILLKLSPNLRREPGLLDAMILRLSEIAAGNVGMITKTELSDEYLPEVRHKASWVKLVIMTNRKKAPIKAALDHLEIRELFDHVFYQSSRMPPKPWFNMFEWGVKETGLQRFEILFIDDNWKCIKAAMEFGLPSKRVMWKADGSSYSIGELF